jgi:uncharacterized repeat protein (TIGR03803 family)
MSGRRVCLPLLLCAGLGVAGGAPIGAYGASLVTLHSFAPSGQGASSSSVPYAGLVRDGAGNLYGTTYAGGAANAGTVFELSPPASGRTGWTARTLYCFGPPGLSGSPRAGDGSHPMGPLVLDPHGVLYGTTSSGGSGGGTVFALSPPAGPGDEWTETVLARFPAGHGSPVARLLRGEDGSLYGTTLAGGTGLGSVFRLSPPAFGQSVLGQSVPGPSVPGPSVAGPSGWTQTGWTQTGWIQTGWTMTVLHEFTAARLDGDTPLTGLAADSHGALYGTTEATAGAPGRGTVYRLTPPADGQGAWREEVLFNFPASGAYGDRPDGDLTIGGDGALYGTAASGGARGRGVVYRLRPPAPGRDAGGSGRDTGWSCSLLTSFTGRYGDASPEGGVVFGPGGTLVGTTAGAVKYQQGTVFELIPGSDAHQSWSMQVLARLSLLARFPQAPRGGGLFPVGDLVGAPDGAFFGVTESGGASGGGTVFEVKP